MELEGEIQESNFIRHWVRVKIEGFRPERLISGHVRGNSHKTDLPQKDETEVVVSVAGKRIPPDEKDGREQVQADSGGRRRRKTFWGKNKARKDDDRRVGYLCFVFYFPDIFVREINIIDVKVFPRTASVSA